MRKGIPITHISIIVGILNLPFANRLSIRIDIDIGIEIEIEIIESIK